MSQELQEQETQEQGAVEQEIREPDDFEPEEFRQKRPRDYFVLLVFAFAIVTICICTVLLVLVINLRDEMNTLREDIYVWKSETAAPVPEPVVVPTEPPETTEVSDTMQVDALENVMWDRDAVTDAGADKNANIRRVYLTFDDGPSSNTDRILDILAQYGVKATFFVVGKDNYNDQYKRIVEEGHTLAMHSYSHVYADIYQSVDSYSQDLLRLHDYLYELTGVDTNIVRFPGGSSNTISRVDMRELIAYLDENGMVYFDWNVSSGDATQNYISANQIAANVLRSIDNYSNAVVLFHDAAGKNSTVEALPLIIEKILESEDTVLLPIMADTAPVQHLH
ncbi:MAG: polysaccharide deacetylase [Roseburia sp.]|nr:polysaccharide deacetylase [Roseburia sp.]